MTALIDSGVLNGGQDGSLCHELLRDPDDNPAGNRTGSGVASEKRQLNGDVQERTAMHLASFPSDRERGNPDSPRHGECGLSLDVKVFSAYDTEAKDYRRKGDRNGPDNTESDQQAECADRAHWCER